MELLTPEVPQFVDAIDHTQNDHVSIVDLSNVEDTVPPLPSRLAPHLIEPKAFAPHRWHHIPNQKSGHNSGMYSNEFADYNSFASLDSAHNYDIPAFIPPGVSSQSSLSGALYLSSPSNSGSTSSPSIAQTRDGLGPNGSAHLSLDPKARKLGKSGLRALKSQCNKFSSRHNAAKANYLRMSLLPFLRKHHNHRICSTDSEQPLAHTVLGLWWEKLLEVVKSNFKHVTGLDRDAFYEALSSIMSRCEWQDHQMQPMYQRLLSETTEVVLIRCGAARHLPVSLAAFTGKVLAYAYTYLAGIAHYLLPLLDYEPSAVDRVMANGIERQASTFRGTLGPSSPCFASTPQHLKSLIGATRPPNLLGLKSPHAIKMISELDKAWERHFSISSSVFMSFFKHYCSIQSQVVPIDHRMGVEFFEAEGIARTIAYGETAVLSAPGMILILAAVTVSLDDFANEFCSAIGLRNPSPYGFQHTQPIPSQSAPKSSSLSTFSAASSSTLYGNGSSARKISSTSNLEKFRVDQLKIMAVIRDILHCEEKTVPFFLAFSRTFDRIFRAVATSTQVYDMKRCIVVCDIADEWFHSLLSVSCSKSAGTLNSYRSYAIDWNFWINVAERMIKCDNCHTQIRAISFLFNHWPSMPNQEVRPSQGATTSGSLHTSSILRDVTEWILSPAIWNHLFCHWSPLVRSYYQRFLCYRIASVGADTSSWFLDVDTAQYITEYRELLKRRLAETYLWCKTLSDNTGMCPELCPSLPMPRLRVGVRCVGPNPSGQPARPETYLTRVHPFDVYDSAAYLQSEGNKGESINISFSPKLDSRASIYSFQSVASSTRLSPSRNKHQVEDRDLNSLNVAAETDVDAPGKSERPCDSTNKLMPSITLSPTTRAAVEANTLSMPKKSNRNSLIRLGKKTTISSTSAPTSLQKELECLKPTDDEPKTPPKLSFLRKLLPGRKTGTTVQSPSQSTHVSPLPRALTPISNANQQPTETDSHVGPKSALFLPPPQLAEFRPDVVRPTVRFVMVPTPVRPPVRNDLAKPRLPFSTEVQLSQYTLEADRDNQKNLAIWNYGGRSLAEWSIEVICFERFAQDQRHIVDDTLEMFAMPYMVTEVPWRTLN